MLFVTAPLVELHNVDVSLPGRLVLGGLTWALFPGHHWAVLGGNGSGKSTFLKLVRGEIWPAPGRGRRVYRMPGEQTTAVGIKEQMPLVSPEMQDRYLQIEWKHRSREVIYSGFSGTDYMFREPSRAQRQAAHAVIDLLDVGSLLRRNVQELSTGELRRVLIARALVTRPRVLLLDEVCDGLDAAGRRTLLSALESVAGSGTQLICTTHRDDEIVPSITHALLLNGGRIVYQGSSRNLPRRASKQRPRPANQNVEGTRRVLIGFDRVNVYLNRARVLRNMSWQMRDGENWAVLGRNGSGKTTFLRLVCGDVHPAAGSRVQRFEFSSRNTLWELRRRIGFLSPTLQAAYRQPLTGRQVVASGFFSSVGLRDRVTPKQWKQADALFATFGIPHLVTELTDRMSYGEFRQILLLRAIVHNPALVACDEPFDGLDLEAKQSFSAALDRLALNGTRLITVTHHLGELPASTTHALVLESGAIVCQGAVEMVRAHDAVRRLFDE